MDAPKVSVIVPVYNGEKYLRECLDSLLGQTMREIEIVCVNDGSTDSSGQILAEYAHREARLRIIEQKNAGEAAARECGLQNATGEYVLFVDDDDVLSQLCAEKTYETAVCENADIVVFGGTTFPRKLEWADTVLSTRDVRYNNDSVTALLCETGSRPFVWNKLYRMGLFRENHIPFPKGIRLGDDQALMFAVLPRASKISYISDKFYHYRQHESNTLSFFAAHPQQRLCEHVKMAAWVLEQWRKTGDIVGHEADWANWALEHVFFEDVKTFELADIQPELRTFLKTFDDPAFCSGLLPHWAQHLEHLRLIARASEPQLVVDFELLRHDVSALKEAGAVSQQLAAEQERSLGASLAELKAAYNLQKEESQRECDALRQYVDELRETIEQLRRQNGELSEANARLLREELTLAEENKTLGKRLTQLSQSTSVLSERCTSLERQCQTFASCFAPVLLPYRALRYLRRNGIKKFAERVCDEVKLRNRHVKR